jgi:cell division protein FtsB
MSNLLIGFFIVVILIIGVVVIYKYPIIRAQRLAKAKEIREKQEREEKLKSEMYEIKDDIEHSPNN